VVKRRKIVAVTQAKRGCYSAASSRQEKIKRIKGKMGWEDKGRKKEKGRRARINAEINAGEGGEAGGKKHAAGGAVHVLLISPWG
jgi:hypothetical protein